MSSDLKDKLEEMSLTSDEIRRFSEAFKKEEFRQLFADYAEEISNPTNRAVYEEEIRQLEKERGMEVKFIHPKAGYVLKTIANGITKTFINICINDIVGSPTSEKKNDVHGNKRGLLWSIPHLFSQPREDFDRDNKRCMVYDFVVHPHTYRMTETNSNFKQMVNTLAIDGLQKMFGIALDNNNCKQIKMRYKGQVTCSVIRNRISHAEVVKPDGILLEFPYPYGNESSSEKAERMAKDDTAKLNKELPLKKNKYANHTAPKFELKYQSDVDLQQYLHCQKLATSLRPQRLIVEIFLPLLSSASSINLDVFEKSVKLVSHTPAKYYLDLPLPYPVSENDSKAKFDKAKHKLILTLAVLLSDCLITGAFGHVIEIESTPFSQSFEELQNGGPEFYEEKEVVKQHNEKEAIKLSRDKEIVETCNDKERSEAIVVVHEKENPGLHSILKLRSSSGSSEDQFSTSFDQLTSGDENDVEHAEDNEVSCSFSSFGSKKSVSFNDHVDQTVYQINQSVRTLHATLKNKRKKFKKKERRFECQKLRQEMRRRNSNSCSCESAPEDNIEDLKEVGAIAENVLVTGNGFDSGLEEYNSQTILAGKESTSRKHSSLVEESYLQGSPKGSPEVLNTTLSWNHGNPTRNVTCSVEFDNPHVFSLDVE